MILPVKDFITEKLKIQNYRNWMRALANEMSSVSIHVESVYGILKWDKDNILGYPHTLANIATPAIHTFYFIPVAMFTTFIWVPKWDYTLTISLIMIPLGFIADISWERLETAIFMRNKELVCKELEKYFDI